MLVVVPGDSIDPRDLAGSAAVDDGPLALRPDPDRDRLHAATTRRPPVPGSLVDMSAPQTIRTMVAISGSGRSAVDRQSAPTTKEVVRGAIAAPPSFSSSQGFSPEGVKRKPGSAAEGSVAGGHRSRRLDPANCHLSNVRPSNQGIDRLDDQTTTNACKTRQRSEAATAPEVG